MINNTFLLILGISLLLSIPFCLLRFIFYYILTHSFDFNSEKVILLIGSVVNILFNKSFALLLTCFGTIYDALQISFCNSLLLLCSNGKCPHIIANNTTPDDQISAQFPLYDLFINISGGA